MQNSEYLQPVAKKIPEEELRTRIARKLTAYEIRENGTVSAHVMFSACADVVSEILAERRASFLRRAQASDAREVYYLCMEFLIGKSMSLHAHNLGIYDALCHICEDYGTSFSDVCDKESEPGLGNGGLGRLASCYMDALSAGDYLASGSSLLYEHGLFRQRIVQGEQAELPDDWLSAGYSPFFIPCPKDAVVVGFDGKVSHHYEQGRLHIRMDNQTRVRAVPYIFYVSGTCTDATNRILFWRAQEEQTDSVGARSRPVADTRDARILSERLYPPDDYDEGKLLRLSQQYLLVSATLQYVLRDYVARYGTLAGWEEHIAFHINDTHPALCIPELMRLLMDEYAWSWDDAWGAVSRAVSYTNHTVLPEALECWREDLFSLKLPRVYEIIREINRRFTADLWNLYPGDWERISRMSVLAYGQVRMANLCVISSHAVNGVSALHSRILKETLFSDYYRMTPWKFTGITNGIAHRRWLCEANPSLCAVLDSTIGTAYRDSPMRLSDLMSLSQDDDVLRRILAAKEENKQRLCSYCGSRGIAVDAGSLFDVQAKRIHEYKRQLLCVLKIMALAQHRLEHPHSDVPPMTFFFAGKAAPGYVMAKKIIRLICAVGRQLSSEPLLRDYLRVVFLENYDVSLAQILLPAADISEQVSLAGKEASGTGCMKMMMSGAATLGTYDGANVEIADAVGAPNAFLFGMNAAEAEALWHSGYDARACDHRSPRLHRVIDRFSRPIGGEDFSCIADYLVGGNGGVADPYMCLADFDAYLNAQRRLLDVWRVPQERARVMLVNIAASGRFSAQVSIQRYAQTIWHMQPVGNPLCAVPLSELPDSSRIPTHSSGEDVT